MVNHDLKARLDALEERFGFSSTSIVQIVPDDAIHDGSARVEWPEDVGPEDIEHTPDDPDAVTETVVPFYRPPEYRAGIVPMARAEVARVYDTMPDAVRERERELRIERGEPIPPILQR